MQFLATRRGEAERGPLVRMNENEARLRLLEDGSLVWVHGPRRQEVAELRVDPALPRGECVLRDVAGVALSESVRVSRVNTDGPPRMYRHLA